MRWTITTLAGGALIAGADTDSPVQEFEAQERVALGRAPDGQVWALDRQSGHLAGLLGGSIPLATRLPEALAIATDGTAVVADSGQDRVLVVAMDSSAPPRAFGRFGAGAGELIAPRGVAITDDLILVADSGNREIDLFTRSGRHRASWRPRWQGAPALLRPIALAVAADGTVAVVDSDRARVFLLDGEGEAIAAFGDPGGAPGLLAGPRGIVWAGGRWLVADGGNDRLQWFDARGRYSSQLGRPSRGPGEGGGRLHDPAALLVVEEGGALLVAEPIEQRVQRLALADDPAAANEAALFAGPAQHFGGALAAAGPFLAVGDDASHRVLVYDARPAEPVLVSAIGGHGNACGRFIRPSGLCFDGAARRLFVSDAGNRRVQEFALPAAEDVKGQDARLATFVRAIDLEVACAAVLDGIPCEPGALALGADGTLFIADTLGGRILVLDGTWRQSRTLARHGADAGELIRPSAVVLDAQARTLVVLDAVRGDLQQWSMDAPGDRPVRRTPCGREPAGLARLADGTCVVADRGAGRLVVVGRDGATVGTIGRPGFGAGEFRQPEGVAVAADGTLFVLDRGNHRVQRLRRDGTMVSVFGARPYVDAALGRKRKEQDS